ncbi:MAG: PAS domain-containing protein [Phycisphaerales bacterium]|nr:PAS domain-containing protein [Phycisphaerae bacterium]NNF42384.1 PAS domain-containing protein [Phycisphaerales bacterium]NNM25491.1 PAS domain-containing protein [Phycisphaerales bacterium]
MSSTSPIDRDSASELQMLRARVQELESEQRRVRADDPMRPVSTTLVQLSRSRAIDAGDLEPAFREITEAAAATLGIERVGIWLFDETRSAIHCQDLFERGERRHSSGAVLAASDFPRYFETLQSNRTVAAHDAAADERTSEFTQPYLEPLGIGSLLDAPIRLGGTLVGIVCHEHVGPPRRWSSEDQAFAGSIADCVALALQASKRNRAQEAVRRSERRLRQIIDLVPHMIFAKDIDGRFLLANQAVADAYGTTVEALTQSTHHEVHRDGPEVAGMLADDRAVLERGQPLFIPHESFTDANGRVRHLQTTKIPFTESGTNEPAMLGVAVDITEQRKSEQRQTLMVRELDHRVKNNLMAIMSIAEQTIAASDSLEQFQDSFNGRLRALAVAHEILAQTRWEGAGFDKIVERLTQPYRRPDRSRFELVGTGVMLPTPVAPVLSMVVHELLVNSAKYGALSDPGGTVRIAWSLPPDDGDGRVLQLQWSEHDGPPVMPPTHRGFGTDLIERMIAYQLHGSARLSYPPSGARCELTVPLPPPEDRG